MKSLRTSSIPTRAKTARLFAALAVICLAACGMSLALGPVRVPLADVVRALFSGEAVTAAERIALYSRLPRTCGCLIAGAALAVSGAVIQGVLSNPLAAPNVIGVNAGAGLAAALCCALAPSAYALVPLAAFVGALLSVLLVLLIAERTGAAKITLVLAGVAVSGILSAGIDAIVTFWPDALNGYSDFRIGSLANLTMPRIAPAFWVVLIALALLFTLTNELDVLMLGQETAHSLGLKTGRMRVLLLALAAALAGAAVSFAGLIGFVGLIVPHIMRRFAEQRCSRSATLRHGRCSLPTSCPSASFSPSSAGRSSSGCCSGRERGARMIETKDLRAGYGGREVLHGVSLAFPPGRVTAIAGPNGCGKSTLLRAVLGMVQHMGGQVLIDGVPAEELSSRDIAQRAAYMPQDRPVPSISVRRMALHGRFPYLSYPRRYRREDHEAVEAALRRADALELAERPMPELSGGQRQRAYLAMALAQGAETVLMDEPTAFLDIRHQLGVMDTARALAAEGRAVAIVTHDLGLALRRADALAVIEDGRLRMLDAPEAVFESGVIDEVFGVRLRRMETQDGPQYYFA